MGGQVVPPVVYRQDNGQVGNTLSPIGKRTRALRDKIAAKTFTENIAPSISKKERQGLTAIEAFRKEQKAKKDMFKGVPLSQYKEGYREEAKKYDKSGITGLKKLSDGTTIEQDRQVAENMLTLQPYLKSDIEDYGVSGGDDTGGGIGVDNIALQNLSIDRLSALKAKQKEAYDIEKGAITSEEKYVDGAVKAMTEQLASRKGITEKFASDVRADIKAYGDKVEARLGKDPYQRQKFWFTVASAIGKKGGNAFTNLADGLKEATNNLDLDRKEKNKLLAELDKQRFNLETKVKEHDLKSKLKDADLTKAQSFMLAKKSKFVQAAVLKAREVGTSYKKAVADALKQERLLLKQKRKDKESDFKVKDLQSIRNSVNDMLLTLGGAFGRIGKAPLGTKELNIQNTLITNATAIANGEMNGPDGKTGPAAVPAYLTKAARDLGK